MKLRKKYKITNEDVRKELLDIRELKKTNQHLAEIKEKKLMDSLMFVVDSVVFKYKKFSNYDDLRQEGMIGLIKSIQKYNADTTFNFFRYSLWWIKARVYRSIGKINIVNSSNPLVEKKLLCVTDINDMDNSMQSLDDDPEVRLSIKEQIKILKNLLNALPEKHKQFIQMRYGIDNDDEESLKTLSKKIGMSHEGLRQLEKRILLKLKSSDLFE